MEGDQITYSVTYNVNLGNPRPSAANSDYTTWVTSFGLQNSWLGINPASATNTQYRDASGRLTGSQTTNTSPSGSFTGTQRDASGRLTGGSTGSGKCQRTAAVSASPPGVKK